MTDADRAVLLLRRCLRQVRTAPPSERAARVARLAEAAAALQELLDQAHAAEVAQRHHPDWTRTNSLRKEVAGVTAPRSELDASERQRWLDLVRDPPDPRAGLPTGPVTVAVLSLGDRQGDDVARVVLRGGGRTVTVFVYDVARLEGRWWLDRAILWDGPEAWPGLGFQADDGTLWIRGQIVWEEGGDLPQRPDTERSDEPQAARWTRGLIARASAGDGRAARLLDEVVALGGPLPPGLRVRADRVRARAGLSDAAFEAIPGIEPRSAGGLALAAAWEAHGVVSSDRIGQTLLAVDNTTARAGLAYLVRSDLLAAEAANIDRLTTRHRWDWAFEETAGGLGLLGTSGAYDRGISVRFVGVVACSVSDHFSHPSWRVVPASAVPEALRPPDDGWLCVAVHVDPRGGASPNLWIVCAGLVLYEQGAEPPAPPPPIAGEPWMAPPDLRGPAVAPVPEAAWTLLDLADDGAAPWPALCGALRHTGWAADGGDDEAALAALVELIGDDPWANSVIDGPPTRMGAAAVVRAVVALLNDRPRAPFPGPAAARWMRERAVVGISEPGARSLAIRAGEAQALLRAKACPPLDAAREGEAASGWGVEAPDEALRTHALGMARKGVVRWRLLGEVWPLELDPGAVARGEVIVDPLHLAGRSEDELAVEMASVIGRRGPGGIALSDAIPNPDHRAAVDRAALALVGAGDLVEHLTTALLTFGRLDFAEVGLLLRERRAAWGTYRLLREAVFGV